MVPILLDETPLTEELGIYQSMDMKFASRPSRLIITSLFWAWLLLVPIIILVLGLLGIVAFMESEVASAGIGDPLIAVMIAWLWIAGKSWGTVKTYVVDRLVLHVIFAMGLRSRSVE